MTSSTSTSIVTGLPPKPPDAKSAGMCGVSSAQRLRVKAEWMSRHGVMYEDTDVGIARAFAQAQQRYRRAVALANGSTARADAERKRRDAERAESRASKQVRPSSMARMQRRAASESQTLQQKLYDAKYHRRVYSRAEHKYKPVHADWIQARWSRPDSRKLQMHSGPIGRKRAPAGCEVVAMCESELPETHDHE